MLSDEEKKYLSGTRLSVKINYVELEENYEDGNIFYYYGEGIVISTVNGETYIDKNLFDGDLLVELLNDIFLCLDTVELILPEEFFTVDIIKKTFSKLTCKELVVDGKDKLSLEQLTAISENTEISVLKVPDIDKNINNEKFYFKIVPNISSQFTSEKFIKFTISGGTTC